MSVFSSSIIRTRSATRAEAMPDAVIGWHCDTPPLHRLPALEVQLGNPPAISPYLSLQVVEQDICSSYAQVSLLLAPCLTQFTTCPAPHVELLRPLHLWQTSFAP